MTKPGLYPNPADYEVRDYETNEPYDEPPTPALIRRSYSEGPTGAVDAWCDGDVWDVVPQGTSRARMQNQGEQARIIFVVKRDE